MVLTPLEAGLSSVCLALFVAVVVRPVMGRSFVSLREFQELKEKQDEMERYLETQVEAMNRMLRALVINSDLPPQEKERLINGRGE